MNFAESRFWFLLLAAFLCVGLTRWVALRLFAREPADLDKALLCGLGLSSVLRPHRPATAAVHRPALTAGSH
jgi:hypothetical protein